MKNPYVDLFYLSPNPYGGWVTYTAHLMAALRAAGLRPNLFKIRPRTERKTRAFGYGERYTNINLDTAKGLQNPKLIVAAAKNFQVETIALLNADAKLVIHDPTEFKNLPDTLDQGQVVVIRQVGLNHVPGACFIPHPYKRMAGPGLIPHAKGTRAVSTSRIDFDKHTDILLLANRALSDEHQIKIHGFENRLYTRFKICPAFPEWKQSKAAYPRDRDAAFNLLAGAEFMVDMSIIKTDGGGTQYTTLEAWDAGAVPIIHEEWIRPGDEMVPGKNCLVVNSPEQLVDAINNTPDDEIATMQVQGWACLGAHSPGGIGRQYKTFLGIEA